MKIIRNDKGITLAALVITIIVLLILASIAVYTGTDSIKDAKENILISEVEMVQHAALERYTQESIMNSNQYPGTPYSSMDDIKDELTELSSDQKLTQLLNNNSTPGDYYLLTPTNLEELQITNTEDSYIINYKLGLAINITNQKTGSGEPAYVYAKDSTD